MQRSPVQPFSLPVNPSFDNASLLRQLKNKPQPYREVVEKLTVRKLVVKNAPRMKQPTPFRLNNVELLRTNDQHLCRVEP